MWIFKLIFKGSPEVFRSGFLNDFFKELLRNKGVDFQKIFKGPLRNKGGDF